MGISSPTTGTNTSGPQKPWADQPFSLIQTPGRDHPKPWDPFVTGATEMANVHNAIIRYLNSIYLQAPYIAASDTIDFIGYSQSWSEILHGHHKDEEELIFPAIEKAAQTPGCMAENVEQHHAFEAGVKEYDEYLATSLSSPATFSGTHLRSIISRFGSILTHHLHAEITSLLSLAALPTASQIDLPALAAADAEDGIKKLNTTTIVALWKAIDKEYEGGIHRGFPPAPIVAELLVNWVWCWRKNRWWKWCPCDRYGRRKELADARIEEKEEMVAGVGK